MITAFLACLLLTPACSQAAVTPAPPVSPGSGDEIALLPNHDASATIGDAVRVRGSEFLGAPIVLTAEQAVVSEVTVTGGRLYAFSVRIDGLDPVAFPTSLGDFLMWDDLDYRYRALSEGGKQPRLHLASAQAGQPVQGWLTFVGPAFTQVIDLSYKPALAEEPAAFSFIVP